MSRMNWLQAPVTTSWSSNRGHCVYKRCRCLVLARQHLGVLGDSIRRLNCTKSDSC